MQAIHWILGKIILLLDRLTRPSGIQRPVASQAAIDAETAQLTLYQFLACPFCVKVRRVLQRQSLNIVTKDAKRCAQSREELLQGGGAVKVPCLKIVNNAGQESWLYESNEIVQYLEERFGEQQLAA